MRGGALVLPSSVPASSASSAPSSDKPESTNSAVEVPEKDQSHQAPVGRDLAETTNNMPSGSDAGLSGRRKYHGIMAKQHNRQYNKFVAEPKTAGGAVTQIQVPGHAEPPPPIGFEQNDGEPPGFLVGQFPHPPPEALPPGTYSFQARPR